MTGASSPCRGERLGADLLDLSEDLDVLGTTERHVFERLARDFERAGTGAVRRPRLAVVAVDGFSDGSLGRDNRLDVVARHELDVVHGEHVRRVRHRNRQGGPGPRERKDVVLLSGFGRNELENRRVDLELIQRNRRNAVLLAEEGGDVLVFDEAERNEAVTELAPVLALRVQGLLELLGCDALLLEKQLANANRHLVTTRHGHTDTPTHVRGLHDSVSRRLSGHRP